MSGRKQVCIGSRVIKERQCFLYSQTGDGRRKAVLRPLRTMYTLTGRERGVGAK